MVQSLCGDRVRGECFSVGDGVSVAVGDTQRFVDDRDGELFLLMDGLTTTYGLMGEWFREEENVKPVPPLKRGEY